MGVENALVKIGIAVGVFLVVVVYSVVKQLRKP